MLVSQHALFDLLSGVCYLDGAAHSPLPRLVTAAGEHGITTKSQPLSYPDARADALAERTNERPARRSARSQNRSLPPSSRSC